MSHAFLHALHETGCASRDSGWSPRYVTLWDDTRLVAAMPLYSKDHSYGEYVFDWAWADAYERLIFTTDSVEDAYRAVARYWHDANEREPEWSRLVIEFMAHASRHEHLRQAVKEVRQRGLDRIVELVEQLAERHGVEYTVPITELVRGSGALNRGLAVEQLLDPELSVEAFEEMHVAYIRGLTKPKSRKEGS